MMYGDNVELYIKCYDDEVPTDAIIECVCEICH